MALTNEDLQAIATLFEPINNRLDGIVTRLDGMGTRLDGMDTRLDGMDTRLDGIDTRLGEMDNRLNKMNNRLEKVESQVSALRAGQIDIRKEIKEVDIKVALNYQLALDAWGTSVENRKWLEEGSVTG